MLVAWLWPAGAGAVSLCQVSGQAFNPDGSTLNNGVVNFNSLVTQVVGATMIPPSLISTTTDSNGNMAPMSVAQGLFGVFTFCQGRNASNTGGAGGGCSAGINGLIPINTTGNISSIIAGVLLPSIGNATVNNLTATNNVMVGGTLQVTGLSTLNSLAVTPGNTSLVTLSTSGLATLGGGLTVTGGTTTDSLTVTGNEQVNGTLNVPGTTTLGSLNATTIIAATETLTSTATALTLTGGTLVSAFASDMNLAAGAHWNGGQWIADQPQSAVFSVNIDPDAFDFSVADGQTPGTPDNFTDIGDGSINGWQFNGSNPTIIAQSFTNAPADIVQILPQNLTQGIGIWWDEIHSIGSNPNVGMNIDAQGTGAINFQPNTGSVVQSFGALGTVNDEHVYATANGVGPTIASCSNGSVLAGSTDNGGAVGYAGVGGTTCLINFGRNWTSSPQNCTCSVALSLSAPTIGSCFPTTNAGQIQLNYSGAPADNTAVATWTCIGAFP